MVRVWLGAKVCIVRVVIACVVVVGDGVYRGYRTVRVLVVVSIGTSQGWEVRSAAGSTHLRAGCFIV